MRFVTRSEWGARPPKSTLGGWLAGKPVGSVVHWEGPRMGTWGHEACAGKMRGIQSYHMDNAKDPYTDIAYNAVVCPHGFVFEGRPLQFRSAANGPKTNGTHAAICYMGGEGDVFTGEARQAIREWTDPIGPDKRAHRDVNATACPGDEITAWVHAAMPGTSQTPRPVPVPLVGRVKDMAAGIRLKVGNDNHVFTAPGGELFHTWPGSREWMRAKPDVVGAPITMVADFIDGTVEGGALFVWYSGTDRRQYVLVARDGKWTNTVLG